MYGKCNLIEAPTIIGKAHNWKVLRRPTPSAIQPLSRHPMKAPPRHILTTRPSFERGKINFIYGKFI